MADEVKESEAPKKVETTVTEVGDTVYTGTVAWFNYKVGYGYIKPDDSSLNGGKDLFVHFKGISDNLAFVKEGKPPFKKLFRDQRVKFNTAKNNRGVIAVNVDKLEEDREEAPVGVEPVQEPVVETPAEDKEPVTETPAEG